jgi:hypothetical protein
VEACGAPLNWKVGGRFGKKERAATNWKRPHPCGCRLLVASPVSGTNRIISGGRPKRVGSSSEIFGEKNETNSAAPTASSTSCVQPIKLLICLASRANLSLTAVKMLPLGGLASE